MGRRKGSKNKPKETHDASNDVRKVITSDDRSDDGIGISILDLTEQVKVREIPILKYSTDAARTKGVEKRIASLVQRHKSFYLTTDVLAEQSDYFVDSGGWAFARSLVLGDEYDKLIGHIKNQLPFLGGPHPVWQQKRSYQRHTVRRGIRLG